MSRAAWFLPVAAAVLPLMNCGGSQHSPDEIYYLVATNVKIGYWQEAAAGLSRAASQLGVRVEMAGPETYDPKGQHEEFQTVLKRKPTGILVSASDPNVLKDDIDSAIAQGIPVITIDSDAPASKRLLFIGTDNYRAGVMGAQTVASLLQGKGNVLIYTVPEQANLKDRLRGYTDIFKEHPQIKISEVVDMKGDPRLVFDKTKELLQKGGKVDAIVCLEATAGPEVAEVMTREKATGKVVVAMDADAGTLDGIQKGVISASVGQKPFTMAFLGVKILDDLHHHPLPSLTGTFAQNAFSLIPPFVDTGATLIDKSNVSAFVQARGSVAQAK